MASSYWKGESPGVLIRRDIFRWSPRKWADVFEGLLLTKLSYQGVDFHNAGSQVPGINWTRKCILRLSVVMTKRELESVWYESYFFRDVSAYMPACSVVSNSATPWTVACHDPLFLGFSRKEHWNELPFPSPLDLPNLGIKPASLASPALANVCFTCWATSYSDVTCKYDGFQFYLKLPRTWYDESPFPTLQ